MSDALPHRSAHDSAVRFLNLLEAEAQSDALDFGWGVALGVLLSQGWRVLAPEDDYPSGLGDEVARARLQVAVDRAHSALTSSAYVGGPGEREAWQIALRELGGVATQHTGVSRDG